MANELEVKAPEVVGVTARTITPTVFITGQYGVNPETVATELTRLMQQLLVYGVFPNITAAIEDGVPAGTYVVIDDPKTPPNEFSVQIVPNTFGRIPADGGDLEVGPKENA
jgi:hypothetical protein